MADMKQRIIDGPLPGESWQNEPRTMPWDRPARFSELNDALDNVFRRLRNPIVSKKLLNLLESGLPVDLLVKMFLQHGFMNGEYGAPIMVQMVPPLVVIMFRMAESAGIHPKLATDRDIAPVDFDPADMLAAEKRISNNTSDKAIKANNLSKKELMAPNMADRQGFMKFRPTVKSVR